MKTKRIKQTQRQFIKKSVLLFLVALFLFPWANGYGLSTDYSNPMDVTIDWHTKFAPEDIPLGEFLEWTAQQEKAYGQYLQNWPRDAQVSYLSKLEQHLKERQGITDHEAFLKRVRRFALNKKVLLCGIINFLFEDWVSAPYTVQAQYTWLIITYSLREPEEIMIFPNDDEVPYEVAIAEAKRFLQNALSLSDKELSAYVFYASFVDYEEFGHRVWVIQTGLHNEKARFLVIDGKTGEVVKNTIFPDAW